MNAIPRHPLPKREPAHSAELWFGQFWKRLVRLVESKLLMPKFIGRRIHLHAAIVIIVLLIGAEFFGPLGMFLAAPLAAIGRILVAHYVLRPRRLARLEQQAAPPLLMKTQ